MLAAEKIIEDIIGSKIVGFRAAGFGTTKILLGCSKKLGVPVICMIRVCSLRKEGTVASKISGLNHM